MDIDRAKDVAGRLHWADTAKGLIILIIVLSHGALFVEGAGYAQAWLRNAIGIFTPVGMPLFFLISGMFSRRHLDGGWGALWHGRLRAILWVLLIWVPIDWMLFALFPNFHDTAHGKYWWQLITAFILPSSYLWFIWSLGAYAILGKVLGRGSPWLWASLAAGVAMAMLGMTTWHLDRYGFHLLASDYYLRGALSYFFYFYAGYAFKPRIVRASRLPPLPAFVVSAVAFIMLALLARLATGVIGGGILRFVAVATGIYGAIFLGEVLASWSGTRRLFGSLGRMTLPIYLTHLLVMVPLAWWLGTLNSPLLHQAGVLTPIIVSIISLAGSVAITALAPRTALKLLFVPPTFRRPPDARRGIGWPAAMPSHGARDPGNNPRSNQTG
ncbi:acyltransferase family protein [Sphingomonas sp. S2-65]|uniref:acyltransferase family protein n=1 Tax=Sphingomonas sp. S2-65 TaxID=2903960 RepID=UPI001F26D6C0|nr:acyltransferase family protein [Sphingomonas sp. S2-65]UYY57055.1 acyltransferase family protein [Sphingomonas sp. S2-65]